MRRGPSRDLGFDITTKGQGAPGADAAAAEPARLTPGELETLFFRLAKFIPPPDSDEFNVQGAEDIAAAIGITAFAPGTLDVPDGQAGVISLVQFFSTVTDATFTGSTFALTRGGGAIQGYSGVTLFEAGGAQAISVPAWIDVKAGDSIGAVFSNAQATARRVGFLLRGWLWSVGEEK